MPAALRKIARIGLVVGVALWLWLVWHAGPSLLWNYLALTGPWMFLLLGIEAVRIAIRAVACRWAMAEERVQFSLPAMYSVMIVTQAIQFVTVAGSVFGESMKALLFSKRVSAARALSSVVLDVLLYQFSAGLFVLVGIAVMVQVLPVASGVHGYLRVVGAVVMGLIILVIVGFARQWRTTLGWLNRMGRSNRTFAGVRSWLEERKLGGAGDQVARFHARHPRLFYQILLADLLAHCVNAFEIWVVMLLLSLPASFSEAVAVAAIGKVLRSTGHLVPGSIGFFEGGIGLIVSAMGSTLAVGTALALVIQVRSVLWAGIGFLVFLWIVVKER